MRHNKNRAVTYRGMLRRVACIRVPADVSRELYNLLHITFPGIVGTARKPERRKPSNEEQSRLHVGLGCWDVCYRSGEGTSSQPVCADAGWNFGT